MSLSGLCRRISNKYNIKNAGNFISVSSRLLNGSANPELQIESKEKPENKNTSTTTTSSVPLEYRFLYPEFLPDPTVEWRNPIREKLERFDMLNRRGQITIPEFYVGTIMAVTRSNVNDPNKVSRFLGICIQRRNCGLRARFTLRNVVDHLGTEIEFHMYDPTIQKIEVLRLEKRLDEELLYLRDALPEYSTFPLDMKPEALPEGPVPINNIKVIMKPPPWTGRWEIKLLQGIDDSSYKYVSKKRMEKVEKFHKKPWEKYDLMKQYRATIPEEEQKEIFTEVYSSLHQMDMTRKKLKRKREFVKPKKTG